MRSLPPIIVKLKKSYNKAEGQENKKLGSGDEVVDVNDFGFRHPKIDHAAVARQKPCRITQGGESSD
jgi:hypothetical protein